MLRMITGIFSKLRGINSKGAIKPLMMSRHAMHVSKLFACVWVISLVLVGHAGGMFPDYIRDRLCQKGFSQTEISLAEIYFSALRKPLTKEESEALEKWVKAREKRTGQKVTEEQKANVAESLKKQSRDLYYEKTMESVLEAAIEAAKEEKEAWEKEEERSSVRFQRWLSDHSDTILTVTKTVYWMFGALSVGLILGYLLGRSSTKGRSKTKDRPSKVDSSENTDLALPGNGDHSDNTDAGCSGNAGSPSNAESGN